MKTETLKALGLTQEQIDSVMAENGKDIKAEQEKYTLLETAHNNLKDSVKKFDGVDVDKLKADVTRLQGELTTKQTEFESKLADIEFAKTVESAVAATNPRNAKAVLALLDMDALKSSKNQKADIDAAVAAVKKDNDYLFTPSARPSGSTGGASSKPMTAQPTAADGKAAATGANTYGSLNDALRSAVGGASTGDDK